MKSFDVIVVGGGHAGVEASHAAAKMSMKTLLVTLNLNMIANMPCNPHIGGSAKGTVVREIDALGGLMGIAADHHPLQVRTLNMSKGPGVRCLRSQQDKKAYPAYVRELLENTENLELLQGEAVDILYEGNRINGVVLSSGEQIGCKTLILTSGTYLNGRILMGSSAHEGGPNGEQASIHLTKSLNDMGIKTWRLKTGTPPRVDKTTIDFSKGEIQAGDDNEEGFSFKTKTFVPAKEQLPCHLIYTTARTKSLIEENLKKSAIFNGLIQSVGPRYCPSIESKIVRFADKEKHQLFLEPEFEEGNSIYLQGFSTGMPKEIQEEMVHSLPGLEKAKILKYAYQIEYDALEPLQYDASLKIKGYEGLYGAGQILGTSGYEEAAGLGLMAGINAALHIQDKEPFILKRNEAYIGVMIDDLVTKGIDEPYRLLSSRAEFRLLLRHDNADERLTEYGHQLGLIDDKDYQNYLDKMERINKAISVLKSEKITDKESLNKYLSKIEEEIVSNNQKAAEILKRPKVSLKEIIPLVKGLEELHLSNPEIGCVETKIKYEGYIARQEREAERLLKGEEMKIPSDFDFSSLEGIRLEAKEKLAKVSPKTISQANRIPGVNPADIALLCIKIKERK